MIYKLEIENFYSIRDHQVIDLTVPGTAPDKPDRFAALFEGSEFRGPKVVTIFGANGSGKSTVLKALSFLAWFAHSSFQHTAPGLPCERFNDEDSAKRLVKLAVEFGGATELSRVALKKAAEGHHIPQGLYRYELDLKTSNGSVTTVSREVLRHKPFGRGKWRRVFERTANNKLLGSTSFPLSGYAQVIDKVRDDASVISTLALFEHEASQILSEAAKTIFSNILVDRTDLSDIDVTRYLAQTPAVVEQLNKELRRIDVGIKGMKVVETATGPTLFFKHEGLLVDMPWVLESHGTRSFIRMFPWLLSSLQRGGVAVIDELDISIHPLILPEVLRWFYNKDHNVHNAQLWLTCHSASLLDDLTKEEIVLCEKDRQGRTTLYTLADIKAVRRSDNLYKKYLSGVFGAVPRIG